MIIATARAERPQKCVGASRYELHSAVCGVNYFSVRTSSGQPLLDSDSVMREEFDQKEREMTAALLYLVHLSQAEHPTDQA